MNISTEKESSLDNDKKTTGRAKIPYVSTGLALKSLRDSGYSLGAALGEVIDNSLEANANNVIVRFDEAKDNGAKKHIHRIIIADDGDGMDVEILQHYLQLGFSTRYMRTDTIGKYGVGAKLGALNYAQCIEVWSRTRSDESWQHVRFDLEEVLNQENAGEETGIEPPDEAPVPLEFNDIWPKGKGTVVVWSKIDRLQEDRKDANSIRIETQEELSRVFRYFLHDGIRISVNGVNLMAHDPLFLMDRTWADRALLDHYRRLQNLKVSGEANPESWKDLQCLDRPDATIPEHFPAQKIAEETIRIGKLEAKLTITLYPKAVVRRRGMGGDRLAEKLHVPENQGSISFVRLNREINYTPVPRIFPRGIQEPDRFIGIEVTFSPEMDSYFGVRNVKRGVEPHDELRRQINALLKKHVDTARIKLDELWADTAKNLQQHQGEHGAIVDAAGQANRTLPKSRVEETDKEEAEQILGDLATDVVGGKAEDKEKYLEKIKDLPFIVESVDFPGHTFIDVQHVNNQVIIRLNTRHRFYREMWEPLKAIAESSAGSVSGDDAVQAARRSIEALTLLIIAYGKAESMNANPNETYGDLRMFWGQFADSLMSKVKNVK